MAAYLPGTTSEASGPQQMPSYLQCVTNVFGVLYEDSQAYGGVMNWPGRWWADGRNYLRFTLSEGILVVSIAVFMTLLRYGLSHFVFLVSTRHFLLSWLRR